FSVYRSDGEHIEVVLNAVGTGTAQLLAMDIGKHVSCLGPLGRGFEIRPGIRTAVLISGGLGVAPMPLAARDARQAGVHVTWVHGARTAVELCSETEGDEVIWATDDGTEGSRGTVVAAAPQAEVVLAAAGPFGYGTEVPLLERRSLGAMVSKGILLRPREGTAPPRIAETPGGMLNAIGLQGPGADALVRDYAPQWADWDFPVLVNINGESASEYGELAARLDGVP